MVWLLYVVSLGVQVVWFFFIFKSLMCDFGYDVVDYCDIDLVFGMLEQFDVLVVEVYWLGLKVMFDYVFNYISSDYVWF